MPSRLTGVKFDIVYRMRAYQYGPQPARFFIWRNDDEHKLGDSPLPDGRVRIFRRRDGRGPGFLGEQPISYVPIKAEIEVNLGPDELVVYETRKMSTERMNFHYHAIPNPPNEVVDGWDEQTQWVSTVRNYRTKPITFELRQVWPGDVSYDSPVKTTLFDYHTIQATFDVDKRSRKDCPATITVHQGSNAKQDRIELMANQ